MGIGPGTDQHCADHRLRELVLDATVSLVQEAGARALTLEAVAAHGEFDLATVEAAFPTIEALAVAVARQTFAAFQNEVAEAIGDDERPLAFSRGVVEALRAQLVRADFPRLAGALTISVPGCPALREAVMAERAAMRMALVRDGLPPADAALLWVVLDGLWLATMLELQDMEGETLDLVFERLRALVRAPSPG